jgi:hypothetical protein
VNGRERAVSGKEDDGKDKDVGRIDHKEGVRTEEERGGA